MENKKDHNLRTLAVICDDDSDIPFAFRPSSMEHAGITVEYEQYKTTKWVWKRFKFVPATHFTEVWYDHYRCGECDIHTCQEGDRFEPGHAWTELDEDLIEAKLKYK